MTAKLSIKTIYSVIFKSFLKSKKIEIFYFKNELYSLWKEGLQMLDRGRVCESFSIAIAGMCDT